MRHSQTSTTDGLSAVLELTGSQRKVFSVLSSSAEPVDVQEISANVDLHPNSVRDALGEMIEVGLVERSREVTHARGRPRLLYEAVFRTDPASLTTEFASFVAAVADELPDWTDEPEREALAIGRSWARRILAQLDLPDHSNFPPIDDEDEAAISHHLGKVALLISRGGFEAKPGSGLNEIDIYGCPFLTGEIKATRLACVFHQGMLTGVLEALSAGQLDAELEPYATPTHCLARIVKSK